MAAADYVDRLEVPTRLDRAEGDIHPSGNPHVHLDPHNIAKVAAVVTDRFANSIRRTPRSTPRAARISRRVGRRQSRDGSSRRSRCKECDWCRTTRTCLSDRIGLAWSSDGHRTEARDSAERRLSGRTRRTFQRDGADAITRSMYTDPRRRNGSRNTLTCRSSIFPTRSAARPKRTDLFGLSTTSSRGSKQ